MQVRRHSPGLPGRAVSCAMIVSGEAAMLQEDNTKKTAFAQPWIGIGFAVMATVIFAWQDAITKTLVAQYPISFIVMVRCWVFVLAGIGLAAAAQGGLRANVKSRCPLLQCLRSVIVISQWLLAGLAMRYMGLAEATALYEAYPLFSTVLAAILLQEPVGWRRYVGLAVGFSGILIMLRPGAGVVSIGAVYALGGALLFAVYMILTRLVGRYDEPQTSFFYVGAVGAAVMTAGLPFFWVDMAERDAWLLALLCLTSISGHFCMIKALSLVSVTVIQPFNYLQLVWSVFVGLVVFGDMPDGLTLLGAAIVVASGLFVFYREQIRRPSINIK